MTDTEDGRGTPDADSGNSLSIYDSNFKAQYILHTDLFKIKNLKFFLQSVCIVFPTALRMTCDYYPQQSHKFYVFVVKHKINFK